MSTLTLRLTKGSALTYQEADDNFTNLNNDKIQNVVEDTTPQLGGNLDVNGNSIVSASNGNIAITPNGTGKVILDGLSWPTADGTSNQVLKTDGAGNLSFTTASGGLSDVVNDTTPQLGGNLDVNGNSIVSASNGNITLAPNGTGKVIISGNLQVDGTTTTINSTTLDVDDINITIAKGAVNAAAANGGGITLEGPTTSATITYASADDSWNLNKLTKITGSLSVSGDIIAPTGGGGDLTLAGDGTGNVNLNSDTVRVGDNNTDAIITTHGTGDLILNTNGGTSSGVIRIYDGANADITLTPNGTGNLTLDGLKWPQADGTANYVLKTDGAGQLSWVAQTTGGITDLVQDTTPQLGGDLDINGKKITTTVGTEDDIILETNQVSAYGDIILRAPIVYVGLNSNDSLITTSGTANLKLSTNNNTNSGTIEINDGVNGHIVVAPNGTGQVRLDTDIVRIGDANSQANLTTNGTGNLRLTTNDGTNSGAIIIQQGTNGNIQITPDGTGNVVLDGNSWPNSLGSANQYLKTDGAGNLSWSTVSSSGITDVVQDTTPQLGGSLDVQSYSITSSVGAITLSPNGTNDVILDTEGLGIGDGTAQPVIYSYNASYPGLTLRTDSTYQGSIALLGGNNGDIEIEPHGTGKVNLKSNGIVIGDVNTNVTLTTSGTGDLILSTGNDTNTGSIRIYDGINGDITLTPNGTGNLTLDGLKWPQADGTNNQVLKTDGAGQLSWTTPSVAISTGVTGLGTGVATFLATPSSANLISAVTDETGTGTLVFSASPTFTGTVSAAALTLTGAATLKDIRETVYAIGNSGATTLTPDAANGSVQTITATGNFTLSAFSNPVSGQSITFIITQDGTGSRTLTSTMKFAGGSKTLSTAASAIDIMTVSYIGTTYYASLSKAFA